MQDRNIPSIKKPSILFLSYFGVGFSPKAPGTMGSLATIPLLYGMHLLNFSITTWIIALSIAIFFTCWITEKVQQSHNLHDPQWIVMDEVLGMITTWLFLAQHNWEHYVLQFALFRLFDIFKIWPATYFDKKMKHGAGTILDDIISGIFAGISYLLIAQYISF